MSANITVRQLTDDDLPQVYDYRRDAEAAAMAGVPVRELDQFLAHQATVAADPANERRVILVDGEVAGDLVSWPQDGRRHVGYWIRKQDWGRGVATAALKTLLAELPERPLYADVLRTNTGSIRVLEKCGFRAVPADDLPPDADPVELAMRLDAQPASVAPQSHKA